MTLRAAQPETAAGGRGLRRGEQQGSSLAAGMRAGRGMPSPPRGAETSRLLAVKQTTLTQQVPGKGRGDERGRSPAALCWPSPGQSQLVLGTRLKPALFWGKESPFSATWTWLRAGLYPQPIKLQIQVQPTLDCYRGRGDGGVPLPHPAAESCR